MSRNRFHVQPGDVPPAMAAHRMGLTLAAFELALDGLVQRGFPPADPTTGNYDLDAVDAWRRRRHESAPSVAKIATRELVSERLARL